MSRPPVHLANLDLNLLVALRELLRARNVTRAAECLGVSQPAASAALSRLRRHFGDELLVRDDQVHPIDRPDAAGIDLADLFQDHPGHKLSPQTAEAGYPTPAAATRTLLPR